MPLNRRTTQQQIDLIITIPIPPQILNTPQSRLTIRNRGIKEVLLALRVNRESLEIDMSSRSKIRLHRSRNVNRRFHGQLLDAILHHFEFYGNHTCHFYGAAKGDFAIALGEVEVAHAEFGAGDVDGEVDFRAAGEVFNVAVSAVFGAAWDGSCAFLADLLLQLFVCGAGVHVGGVGGLCYIAVHVCAFGDELVLAAIPFGEDFSGGSAAEDTRVDEAGEADVWDMSGRAEYAFEIPDGFCTVVLCCVSGSLYLSDHGLREQDSNTYASGYSSSKNPPPFSFAKIPVNPQGCSCKGCTS